MSHETNALPGASAPARVTAPASGAARIFREFKWGLLTLFLLMVVVIGLVYDGGKKKQARETPPSQPITPAAEPRDEAVDEFRQAGNPPPFDYAQPDTAQQDSYTQTVQGSTAHVRPQVSAIPPIPPAVPEVPRLLEAPPVQPVTAVQPPAAASGQYVVQSGDTLSGIAAKHYPGRMHAGIKAIVASNKDTLPNPDVLRVGTKLKMPALDQAPAPAEVTSSAPAATPAKAGASAGEYTVQSGDTLERIARKLLSDGRRWQEIYELNRDRLSDPARLRVGQKLRVPTGSAAQAAPEKKEAPTAPMPATSELAEQPQTAKTPSVVPLNSQGEVILAP